MPNKKRRKLIYEGKITVGDLLQFAENYGPLIVRRLNKLEPFVLTRKCKVIIENI